MRKDCYFHEFNGPFWPSASDLESYFLAQGGRQWISAGGNDNWGLEVQGIEGTEGLPRRQSVNVNLRMTGNPEYGVTLEYDKWDGRIQQKESFVSKGNLDRLNEFVRSLHGDPLSIGLFIPFDTAWHAVKEFIETDGELPKRIEWIKSRDLLPQTFPDPVPPVST